MKYRFLLFSLLLGHLVSAQTTIRTNFAPEPEHSDVSRLVGQILSSGHYQPAALNDDFSAKVFDNYLKDLDYSRSYFLAADVAEFNFYRSLVDDAIQSGNVEFAFTMYNRFLQRINNRIQYTYKILNGDSINFNTPDSFQVKREEAPWCKDEKELDNLWDKKIKYELVGLKASGKNWKDMTDVIRKRYENLEKQLVKTQSEDIYSYFMNAVTETVDPHTNYFSPKQGDDFKINTSQALEGIGATLQTENDYTKIRELVKGGPAERSKLLKVGDRIVSVGQGKDGEMLDIVGWRIDDVVSKIRGPKGSIVRLGILGADEPSNAAPHIIQLERDKIKLEDQTAKGEIQKIKNKGKEYKVAVITLPSFYYDFAGAQKGEKNFSSTTRDVRRLIENFKADTIDAVVLDLRNNGGGSLLEAINLTGLFIKSGPVVQVRNSDGSIKVEQDYDNSVTWSGPLAVLVNRFSASASEILAGAIQDYKRGIIIGENTFGKGTVQNVIDLGQYIALPNGRRVGQVKLTLAKFYRINGSSTQLKGVKPDIEFPSIYADKEYGEEASKYAMAWDQINTSRFEPVGMKDNVTLALYNLHKARMKSNTEYNYLLDDVVGYRAYRLREYATLNLEQLKKEQDEQTKKNKEREEARKKLLNNPKDEQEKYDLILRESEQILVDFIVLGGDKLTSK
ncbi:MAG: carboxy terminal-processing peptidase [Bacteroidia bacterium]|nr:carboxy terminal-processing peptidase [Bacteroidia bacterium]MBP7260274.1 carboxy terminal-processing peptidase [Bacteroidia bacterium]MBP9179337.1 carboxy terminal-processing peptidase [Bacteroidia bacterium]MBP9724859.1 carboxy terminal-processing peptidase [Bacteroidia bacterium]